MATTKMVSGPTPTSFVVAEAFGEGTFTLMLGSEPTSSVAINLASSDGTLATLSAPSVAFDSMTWNTVQTVTVTGAIEFKLCFHQFC